MEYEYLFSPIAEEITYYHSITTEKNMEQGLTYHRHNAYEIYLFLSGHTKVYLEQTCYSLTHGDLIIISPDELHRSVCLDTFLYERIGINIKKSAFERLSTPRSNLLQCFETHLSGRKNLVHLNAEQLHYYISLASNLNQALCNDAPWQDILVDTYMAQLLVFINTLYSSASESPANIMPEFIKNTMSYIREHLTEDITLMDLSKEFNFNGKYISYKFKQLTGLTLRSYILDQKIALAKQLLTEGKTVSETCEASGFKDYSNFIRSFTNTVGISPGKYKHSIQYIPTR